MRQLIKGSFLLAMLFLCSCATMKNKKTSTAESATELNQGTVAVSSSVDTSKKESTNRWRAIFPPSNAGFNQVDLPKLNNWPLPDLTGATEAQKAAVKELQGKYTDLQGSYNKLSNSFRAKDKYPMEDKLPPLFDNYSQNWPGLILEYEGTWKEQNYKTGQSSVSDSTIFKSTSEAKSEELVKNANWLMWFIFGLCVFIFLVIPGCFVYWVNKANR